METLSRPSSHSTKMDICKCCIVSFQVISNRIYLLVQFSRDANICYSKLTSHAISKENTYERVHVATVMSMSRENYPQTLRCFQCMHADRLSDHPIYDLRSRCLRFGVGSLDIRSDVESAKGGLTHEDKHVFSSLSMVYNATALFMRDFLQEGS